MGNKKIHIGIIILSILILSLYCYFRIKPIYFQTVGYTYDQGRDFLKTAEVVLYKNPTFIGPTTGIMGVYHGAWWYYVLAIPFILFKGLPISFYYFNFIVQLITFIIFACFLKKHFSTFTAVILSFLIAISPYFIYTSTFVANNVMAPPAFLIFLISNFYILEKKVKKPLLISVIAGLFLGLTAEFELSFGLFLIPAYIFLIFFLPKLRNYFFKISNAGVFTTGLFIAFAPRILFELKHSFQQTKILLSFFSQPKFHNAKLYSDVLKDRFNLFQGYYWWTFPHKFLAIFFLLTALIILIYALKNKVKFYRQSILFLISLLILLFIASTFYKDSFWANYYEGIQYIFLFIIAAAISTSIKLFKLNYVKTILIIFLILYGSFLLYTDLQKKPKKEGIQVQTEVINYIQKNESNKDNYCARVYTPPVIPYTYDYLFLYNKLTKKINSPTVDYVDNKCWYIIEDDTYKFRIDKWKDENIPKEAKIIISKIIGGVSIYSYELPKKN